jgi:tetratricopeptide (TPR) repeat protein
MLITKLLISVSLSLWISTQVAASADIKEISDDVTTCRVSDHYHNLEQDFKTCDRALVQSGLSDDVRAELLAGRGEAAYFLGHTQESLGDFDNAIKLNPNFRDAHYKRAWALIRSGRSNDALKDAYFILGKNKNDDGAYLLLGYIHEYTRGTGNLAFAEYQHALKINPNNLLARFNLAGIYFGSDQQKSKAIEQYDILLAASDEAFYNVKSYPPAPQRRYDLRGRVRDLRATALIKKSNIQELLPELNAIIETYPDESDAWDLRAQYYFYKSDWKNTLADSRHALELNPRNGRVLSMAFTSLNNLRLVAQGYELANDSISQFCGCINAGQLFYWRGVFAEHLNKFDDALNDYEKSVTLDPQTLHLILFYLIQDKYYDGNPDDQYSPKIRNGLKACIIDPACTA